MPLPALFLARRPGTRLRTGIALALYASDPAFELEIERAPESSGAPDVANAVRIARRPGGTALYVDDLPLTGERWYYRLYHVADGYEDSDPTDWVSATPRRLDLGWRDVAPDERAGGDRGYRALSQEAHLEARVQVVDTATALRPIARGLQLSGLRDGDAVVFDPPFQNPPIVLAGGGGITYRSAGLTGNQRQRLSYAGLSASGFTAVCKIEEVQGTTTARSGSFSAGGTRDWEYNKAFAAQAVDDTYTFEYRVQLQPSSYVQVEMWVNDGSGWVLKATRPYVSGGVIATYNDDVPVVADGMDLNDDFGIDFFQIAGSGTISLMAVTWTEGAAPVSFAATAASVTVPYLVLGL